MLIPLVVRWEVERFRKPCRNWLLKTSRKIIIDLKPVVNIDRHTSETRLDLLGSGWWLVMHMRPAVAAAAANFVFAKNYRCACADSFGWLGRPVSERSSSAVACRHFFFHRRAPHTVPPWQMQRTSAWRIPTSELLLMNVRQRHL